MLENKTAIIGYGGHAYVVADSHLSNSNSLNYYTNIIQVEKNPFSLAYLGCETDPNFEGWDMNLAFILGIGENNLRYKIAQLLLSNHQIIESVIDPNSIISERANIGVGVFASKGVLVNAFSQIGDFTILNTGCIIEHECEISTAVHISPGAVLAGDVKIGKRSFIGANSVITKNVPPNIMVAGSPYRILKAFNEKQKPEQRGKKS